MTSATAIEKQYNSAQPRVPPGVETGGQWTVGGWMSGVWAAATNGMFKGDTKPAREAKATMGQLDTATSDGEKGIRVTSAQFRAARKHFEDRQQMPSGTVTLNGDLSRVTALAGVRARGSEEIAFTFKRGNGARREEVLMRVPRDRVLVRNLMGSDLHRLSDGKVVSNTDASMEGHVIVSLSLRGGPPTISDVWAFGAVPKSLTLTRRVLDGDTFDEVSVKMHERVSSAVYTELRSRSPQRHEALVRAVKQYEASSSPINDALRGHRTRGFALTKGANEAGRQAAATLVRTFREHRSLLTMRAPVDLFRGIRGDLANQLRTAKVGTRFHDGGFTSFTMSPLTAENFFASDRRRGESIMLRIERGSTVRALPAARSREQEFILDSAFGYEITKRRRHRNGVVVIDVRPIDLRRKR